MTFKDLIFEPHEISFDIKKFASPALLDIYPDLQDSIKARHIFKNGYGISVIQGSLFYTNSKTYEVAVLKDNQLCYDTYITKDVLAYQSKDEITQIMKKIEEL